MGNFLTLVSVENTKLWKRLSSKIMIIILIAVVVGLCGLYKAEEVSFDTKSKGLNL